MGTLSWREDLDHALDAGRGQDKPLFLDFFNPG
jgi:hypothetical protein